MTRYGVTIEWRVDLPERGTPEYMNLYETWLEEDSGWEQIADWKEEENLQDLIDDALALYLVVTSWAGNNTDIVQQVNDDFWQKEVRE